MPNTETLAKHMRKEHNRLILDIDFNRATAERRAKRRAIEEMEELVA